MKRLHRAAAALVLALVLVPAPALAALPDPMLEPVWPTLLCTSGAIENTTVSHDALGFTSITLTGYVDCARAEDIDAYYGFATYHGTGLGLAKVVNMQRYATVPPSHFSETMYTYFFGPSEFGICLIPDRKRRIGCVKVVYDGQTVTVEPLPTNAPLVARQVWVENDTGFPWPFCGTCW
jgi:hypothetical protein